MLELPWIFYCFDLIFFVWNWLLVNRVCHNTKLGLWKVYYCINIIFVCWFLCTFCSHTGILLCMNGCKWKPRHLYVSVHFVHNCWILFALCMVTCALNKHCNLVAVSNVLLQENSLCSFFFSFFLLICLLYLAYNT